MTSKIGQFVKKHTVRIGKTIIFGFSCGTIWSNWAPNTVFLDKYKDLLEAKQYDMPYPMTPELTEVKSEVFKDLMSSGRFSEKELEKLDVIFSPGALDPFHKGSIHTSNGALVCIPMGWRYADAWEFPLEKFRIRGSFSFEEESPEGKAFKRSMILEKNELKFALMRECLLTDSYYLYVRAILQLIGFTAYGVTFFSIAVPRGTPLKHLLFIQFCGVFFALTCLQIWVPYCKYRERKADEEAADFGLTYIQGGIDYYAKVLQRNAAIHLLEKQYVRTNLYTKKGNVKTNFFFDYTVPFTARRSALQEKLEKSEEK